MRTEGFKLDGRLEGIIRKTIVDLPKSDSDAEAVRGIWNRYAREELVERFLGLMSMPPSKNGIPERSDMLESAQNKDYLLALRKFKDLLGIRYVF